MERIRKWGLRALITVQSIGWIGVILFLLDLPERWEALKHYDEIVHANIFYILAFLLGSYSAYVILLHFAVRRVIRQVKEQNEVVEAIATLHYLEVAETDIKQATDLYWASWKRLEEGIRSRNWREADLGSYFSQAADEPANTLQQVKSEIARFFKFDWDGLPKLTEPVIPPIPEPGQLGTQEMVQKYQEVYVRNKHIQHQIMQLQHWLFNKRTQARSAIAKAAPDSSSAK